MNWLLFTLITYLAFAANVIVAPVLAWGEVRPDFLLLLLPVVAFLDGPNRGLFQAFLIGAAIDFSGAAPPGIYATCTVVSLGIVRHFTRNSLPESPLGWLCRALVLMLLIPTFALVWEATAIGAPLESRWFLSHILAPVLWSLGCGIAMWLGGRLLLKLLPRRASRWSDRPTENTPFFLSR